jgi:hypothetical protein
MLRRRPVMRAAATTAVVAGTATAVSGRVARRQAGRADQAAAVEAEPMAAASAPPPPPPEPASLSADAIEQLKALASLHEQGALTDDEFADAKAKVLGS